MSFTNLNSACLIYRRTNTGNNVTPNYQNVLLHSVSCVIDELNSKLDKNIVHEKVKLPMGEDAIKVHRLSNEQVEEYKNTEYYKYVTSIVKKLSSIKELIIDSAPEILENISDNE